MAKTKYNLHLKGYVGGWDFDSDYVDFVLNKNTDKEVAVLIDSLGGQLIDVYLGNPMQPDEKYLIINQGFAGKQRLMPYFNRQNNDDLILAIQSAGVERWRNGFRKNKSMEKQPESEEDLLEHRTDGTDAFDTLYIGCEKFPQHDLYPICVGGVR